MAKMKSRDWSMKPTPKVPLLSSFATIIFVLGLVAGSALVFASIPVVIYLALSYVSSTTGEEHSKDKINKPKIKVSRSLEKSLLYDGDESRVKIRITNFGRSLIPFLKIEDSVPGDLKKDKGSAPTTIPIFTLSLKAGESRDLVYWIKANRLGVFSLGPLRAELDSGSGGLYNGELLYGEESSAIVVLPREPERLTHFKIRPRKTKPWPGEIVARRIGQGMDNYSIREFYPGDSFRRVNWRASAKQTREEQENTLMLNEQSAELGADTIVIVDARPQANVVSSSGESLVDCSVRASIALTDKLLRDRNRVGLVTIGADTERIAPGYGRRQYNRLVLSLVRVRAGGYFTFENIPTYLRFFYPHLAQVVLVSPLADGDSLKAAAEISRSGYELLAVSPNPIDFSTSLDDKADSDEESRRNLEISVELARLQRRMNLGELSRAPGVIVLDWRKGDDLDYSLSKTMKLRRRPV